MAVWEVQIIAPNGNRVARPIVADSADDAMALMAADHDIAESDPSFQIIARQRTDPDGTLEKILNEAEIRRLENEFYRFASKRRGRR